MITIPIKVCGDYWANPKEVSALLDQVAGKSAVLLDLQAEGPSLKCLGIISTLDAYCQKYQADPRQIFIQGWCNLVEPVDYNHINGQHISHFFERSQEYWQDELPDDTHEHVVGFFIGRRSIPRVVIMHYLHRKYQSQSLLSCLKTQSDHAWRNSDSGVNVEVLDDWLSELQQKEFIEWWNSDPISSLDNHSVMDQYIEEPVTNQDLLKFYHRFDIELVAESYTRGNSFFPTEKTVRPIMAAKPILVYGPVGYLERLRALGFETYSKIWDESYDRLEGPARWNAIQSIVDSFMLMDPEDRLTIITAAKQIACRNRDHLEKLIKRK